MFQRMVNRLAGMVYLIRSDPDADPVRSIMIKKGPTPLNGPKREGS
jgi:hypothetical protein